MDKERIYDEEPSEELARMAQETIESQSGMIEIGNTRHRCERVVNLYERGFIRDMRDNFHAALIMLYGDRTSYYKMSRLFARAAARQGEIRAWTLEAMAWDRWLLSMGKPQRFGTQIIKQHGQWTLSAVDERVTDEERALYGVPPLFVQKQRVRQLQREEDL